MRCAQVEGRGGIHLCVLPPGANLTFSNQTNGSALLFWQNIFTWPVREACNTLWSARCFIWKAFSCEWVDIRQILTKKKNFHWADRSRQNDSTCGHSQKKKRQPRGTVCGLEHPVGSNRTPDDLRLSFPFTSSFPTYHPPCFVFFFTPNVLFVSSVSGKQIIRQKK